MLAPTKHTEITYSVLYISGRILKYLQEENIILLDDLTNVLVNELGNKVKNNINISLTFLYSLSKIQYIKELDAITLIEVGSDENK